MRTANIFKNYRASRFLLSFFALSMLVSALAVSAGAQSPQLSLADLLIGLRSKKLTLTERNKILTDAVRQRGVTFTISPEIEKELATTGADAGLLAAIRSKGQPAKPAATPTPAPKPVATPIPTPTPPDSSFYQKRADASMVKGEFDSALVDYNRAVELKADDPLLFVGRGRTHFNLKSYDLSVKDFDKAVELNPNAAIAFLNRGASFEKLGNKEKALADYQRAATLDNSNETAKAEAKRLQDEFAMAAAAKSVPAPLTANVKPEFLNLGNLSAANAVRMVTPVYSAIAQRSAIEGRVTVEVEINAEGNVVSAKATSGHAMLRSAAEDAAKKSKFKPAMFNNEPIKAIGSITYNFALRGVR